MPPLHLNVYVRTYCHLCHDLIAKLAPYQSEYEIRINTIDIDTDPDLEARYGPYIPVLTGADDAEICHYFLDDAALTAYLAKIR
ncbi:MAG TPA: glutaredoxin family protein [Burkholderiales bacterium]|nr:glutaredoxin family protein [Burkholderiales bacterium]